jgi:hypothetical protein
VSEIPFPTTQRELLLLARGSVSQDAFARRLGVDRSCLSRYERERLGVPISVLIQCLSLVAREGRETDASPLERALLHVQQAADALVEASERRPAIGVPQRLAQQQ